MIRKVTYNPYYKVQSGLAYTPSQMMKAAESGIPVNGETVGVQFDEGSPDCKHTDLTIDRMRGVDMVDMWQAQQNIHQKFRTAVAGIDFDKAGVEKEGVR